MGKVRDRLRLAPLVALACLCLSSAEASAAPQPGCSQHALHDLQQLAPDGYAIYTAISDKTFFLQWITCDNVQVGLATAVHESVHHLTEDRDAYPLIGDKGEVKRPHEVSKFAAPATIAKSFSDGRGLFRNLLVSTYLQRGSASSADDFLYLLDELNAYTHDLHAAVALNSLHAANESIGERDGLAAMMAFVGVYVAAAEESQSPTWAGLRKPKVAEAIATLWTQAETTMAASCGIANLGQQDAYFMTKLCADKPQSSLQKILGRAPLCPKACLQKETADVSPDN
jgi:hypothetical protein